MCGIFGYCSFLKPKVYPFFSFLFDARYRGWLLLDLAARTKATSHPADDSPLRTDEQ